MTREAAQTGIGPMALVAVEQRLPVERRIVVDDLAAALLPTPARWLISLMGTRTALRLVTLAERRYPGLWGGMLCRKRFIDDALTEALPHIDAFVNLGAGFDTRAFRLLRDTGVPAWELDQPANIDAKRQRLLRRFGKLPANVTLVAVDFEHLALDAVLAAQGYTRSRRAFFVWEGVTQYLDSATVHATFEMLGRAAAGSRLAFTYVSRDFLEGKVPPGQEALYRRFVARGAIWRFGIDPEAVRALLAGYGWRVIAQPEPEALARRYIAPTGRLLDCMPMERVVLAERV
ncbi:S-adenosyl-L-methionine-dependent methyltransferase [Paraburkholderia tropica]|uniref:SAM-dependent methyltransferase n=1 Tax=Paraburkholderia tropica TaxID=92647 RepID=UPI001CB678A0|nr:SAM-dependent methyltransferase [Paraburkholderia tropica]CAG9234785.1 S-adenosyl-L-methionine-dependent methyltransferase [Paraburkholderia tropica]